MTLGGDLRALMSEVRKQQNHEKWQAARDLADGIISEAPERLREAAERDIEYCEFKFPKKIYQRDFLLEVVGFLKQWALTEDLADVDLNCGPNEDDSFWVIDIWITETQ
jgi:hypothetical protein